MASTYSTNLAIELIGTGDQAGTWGVTTNTNLGTLIEQAISGYVTQAVATGTDTTITIPNGATGVARNMYIELTGTGGASTNLIVPSNKKLYFIFNNTSSGQVTVKVSGQTGVSVPNGKKMVLVCNGTDVVNGLNYIADFGTNSFTVTNLTASSGTITNLIATTGTITTLSATSGNISNLVSSDASATVLRAGSATLTHLSATSASITNLTLTSLVISNLSIASANITTLTSSSATISTTLALSGGTANGVLYLNGSKVATSGSALTFTGTNFGVTNAGNIEFTLTGSAGVPQFSLVNGAGTQYIQGGLGGSNNMVFGIGNTEQMRLTSTGLGIGTSSPTHKLQTNGSGRFGTMTTGPGLLSGSSDTFQVGLNQDNTNTTNTQVWAEYVNGATSASWAVRYRAANDTGTASTRLFLDAASGNLGIGTSSPDNKLEVTVGDNAGINIEQTGAGQTGYLNFRDSDGVLEGRISYDHSNNSLRFATSQTEKLRITSAGDVGIGTSSPGQKLDVRGANSNNLSDLSAQIVNAVDTTAYAQNNGGGIGFGYVFNSGGSVISRAAVIKAVKENATDGNYATSLVFANAANSSNTIEKMRLDSSGNLGLGVTPSAWSGFRALQVGGATAIWSSTSGGGSSFYSNNVYFDGSNRKRINAGFATEYIQDSSGGAHIWFNAASSTADSTISFTQAMTLDASGNLLLGSSSTLGYRSQIFSATNGYTQALVQTSAFNSGNLAGTVYSGYYDGSNITDLASIRGGKENTTSGNFAGMLAFYTRPNGGSDTERARITSGGDFLVGKTANDTSNEGFVAKAAGGANITSDDSTVLEINRKTSDGTLVSFRQDNTQEGTISVSGNTVSYNAFAGSHWSQLQDGSKPDILRGTVMESINELCVWPGEQNERLPKSKVSDTAGSKKVYGVFMAWDNDWTETNDMYVTAVGAFICRINSSVTVQEGDLLESNGDGTARVQADDIIRSSTIGKVTSTVKTHQYDDGSYCVPTVLYCG